MKTPNMGANNMTQTADLLLEIFSEEIPSGLQARAVSELADTLGAELKSLNLTHDDIATYTTPRRLVICIHNLPTTQPDTREERKGPRVGAPDKAVEGFLRGAGLNSLDDCQIENSPKGDFYVAVIEKKGRPTADVLSELITTTLNGFTWPKSMRFADFEFRWVRPLRHVLAVFDGKPLDGGIDMGNGTTKRDFTNTTVGHRFMGTQDPITVTNFNDYQSQLAENGVVVDNAKRRADILSGLQSKASELGLQLVDDNGLLDEVTGLVEHVNVLVGRIDDDFMSVAQECIILSMREHQKYFSFKNNDGTLAPYFATVANITTYDNGAKIIDGNERVLRSRLSDAKFFWENDCNTPLEDLLPKLDKVVFHAKLGTVSDRVNRMGQITELLMPAVAGADKNDVQTAVQLCKADLMSQMVYEFPELQGVMGQYYARQQGKGDAVATAIAEHYSPLGPSDTCPTAPVSVVVALAEKLDTLVGFWLIDEKPTGSKDPYALRRGALGVIRLILENNLQIDLVDMIRATAKIHNQGKVEDAEDVFFFIMDRLKVHLKNDGIRHDVVEAVFYKGHNLFDIVNRAQALQTFLASDNGDAILQLYRRAGNIVSAEEKKDGVDYGQTELRHDIGGDADDKIMQFIDANGDKISDAINTQNYTEAMNIIATGRTVLDAFFEDTKINDDNPDIRKNRLNILGALRNKMNEIADFSLIE